ncbi:hypothetical protein M378DRAFT_998552 [Amanita muscaria Koide BX008]|uniref:Uncharacterized protein n=1 Tax=Amanita muscaria (strain Koide BX008) TaxID=946122 RepID=A0A0C2WSA7_AMAMK|nr:hypothetical protein M378DRAFT_998552 [Amanita muscaria Koide BX008]
MIYQSLPRSTHSKVGQKHDVEHGIFFLVQTALATTCSFQLYLPCLWNSVYPRLIRHQETFHCQHGPIGSPLILDAASLMSYIFHFNSKRKLTDRRQSTYQEHLPPNLCIPLEHLP